MPVHREDGDVHTESVPPRRFIVDESATDMERLAVMMGAQIREAVRDGISQAISDPLNWAHAVGAIHEHAQKQAGTWLFGGLRVLVSRALWVALAGLAIYMIGGWSALVAFFKTGQH